MELTARNTIELRNDDTSILLEAVLLRYSVTAISYMQALRLECMHLVSYMLKAGIYRHTASRKISSVSGLHQLKQIDQ